MDYENESFEINVTGYDNVTKAFLKEINKYPMMSQEEFLIYHKKYMEGDPEASKKIVEGFLRLIVWCARKKMHRVSQMQLLDLIQEGSMGIYKALDKYDVNSGVKFSSYVVLWINQNIGRGIEDKDRTIRFPAGFHRARSGYKKIIYNCKINNLDIPTDEEICEKLKISTKTLELIRQDINNLVSLNSKFGEDDDENELGDFVGSEDNSFNSILNEMIDKELLIVLKEVLQPNLYYILYKRVLSNEPVSLKEIGTLFGVSRERIRQLEVKALNRAKPYIIDLNKRRKVYDEICLRYGKKIDSYDVDPKSFDLMIKFLYIKENISEIAANVFYLKYINSIILDDSTIMNKYMIDEDEYYKILDSYSYIFTDDFIKSREYIRFKNSNLRNMGGNLLLLKPSSINIDIDYKYISNLLNCHSLEEIIQMYPNVTKLPIKEFMLLKNYMSKGEQIYIPYDEICRDITTLLYGYKRYDKHLKYSVLYDTYINNKDSYTEQQKLCLECLVFNMRDKEEYFNKYSRSSKNYRGYAIEKTERIYFNIDRYLDNNFTKEKYEQVKRNYPDALSLKRIEIMDLVYGVNGEKKTISELAVMYNEEYDKMHDFIRNTRDYIISLYVNRTGSLNVDSSVYLPYILDESIDFPEKNRKVLLLRFKDGLSYEEIKKEIGLDKTKISNIITDAIRKIDTYRFGIIKKYSTTEEEIDIVTQNYTGSYKEIRNVLYDYFIYRITKKKICEKYDIDEKSLNSLIKKYKEESIKYRIKDIVLTKEDVSKVVDLEKSLSILTERDKEILSMYYGVKNKYNQTEKKYSIEELAEYYSVYAAYIRKYMNIALLKAKKYKGKMIDDSLFCMEKMELENALKDSHLPISKKERDIICYLFGLFGYEIKSLEELSIIYNENSESIKRRYQRAILSIKKYFAKELEGIISYEEDILPNLKYFSTYDRSFLVDFYANSMSYNDMANKYGLTFNQIVSIWDRLKVDIYDLLNDQKTKRFDFDYFDQVIDNDDLPYYGDKEFAKKAFSMYFGHHFDDRLAAVDVIKELGVDIDNRRIIENINGLMLAVCKYKEGITKENSFSRDEVLEYYNKYNITMKPSVKKMYLRYLRNSERKGILNIPYKIIYDLMNERGMSFNIRDYSKETLLGFIDKYRDKLNNRTKNYILQYCGISRRDFMNGKEIGHLYKVISNVINGTKKINDEKKLMYLGE